MRLLNAKSQKLSSFFDGQVPDYAILSHTWDTGEVSYQDIQSWLGSRWKAGWRKIQYTCEQALKDGLEWVWIDTCCIDRRSSAELSEAINSMFNWYRESTVCYAYLNDVEAKGVIGIREAIRRSRWFTRGWTLQELIAPNDVQFFSASWTCLGSRQDLSTLIAEITSVDEVILDAGSPRPNGSEAVSNATPRDIQQMLSGYSVAEKMSWAAFRQTTRVEDRAYSLLGLFAISMPLIYELYGERHKAFKRLQEAIIDTVPDPTILIWGLENPARISYASPNKAVILTWPEMPPTHNADGPYGRISSWLAPTPEWFSGSRHVIPSTVDAPTQSMYAHRDLGLEFEAPVIRNGAKSSFVILNCTSRYRSELYGMSVAHGENAADLNYRAVQKEMPPLNCWLNPHEPRHIRPLSLKDYSGNPKRKIRLRNPPTSVLPFSRQLGLEDPVVKIWIRKFWHPSFADKDISISAGFGSHPTMIQVRHQLDRLPIGNLGVESNYVIAVVPTYKSDAPIAVQILNSSTLPEDNSFESCRLRMLQGLSTCSAEAVFSEDGIAIHCSASHVSTADVATLALDVEVRRQPGWEAARIEGQMLHEAFVDQETQDMYLRTSDAVSSSHESTETNLGHGTNGGPRTWGDWFWPIAHRAIDLGRSIGWLDHRDFI